MDELQGRFADRSAAEREELQAAWAADDRDVLKRLAHSLAGSAGLFGYPDLSNAARDLEAALDQALSPERIRPAFDAVMRHIPGEEGTISLSSETGTAPDRSTWQRR